MAIHAPFAKAVNATKEWTFSLLKNASQITIGC